MRRELWRGKPFSSRTGLRARPHFRVSKVNSALRPPAFYPGVKASPSPRPRPSTGNLPRTRTLAQSKRRAKKSPPHDPTRSPIHSLPITSLVKFVSCCRPIPRLHHIACSHPRAAYLMPSPRQDAPRPRVISPTTDKSANEHFEFLHSLYFDSKPCGWHAFSLVVLMSA